ncbi:MAG: hypothetical protein H0V07_06435 [Propionibacteriales bacterium]|nr:hypothetical protein [Propionibacteriales bacterium]
MVWFLVGYPIWWVLGLATVGFILAAVPMAIVLARRRPLRYPPAFLIWLIFCMWVLLSTLMLGVNPTGTVTGAVGSRLLPSLLVRADYLAATIALLYIGNLTERELPRRLLEKLLTLMFVWVVAGGLLGLIYPGLQFTSVAEMLLPHSISTNAFVKSLIHPSAAQIQDALGYSSPRPSAPWGYTNIWGNNFGVLIVWFVYTWCVRARGRRTFQVGGVVFLATALVVATLSLNRGLWIGLVLAVVYLMVQLARNGHARGVVSIVGFIVLCSASASLTPLGDVVVQRFETGQSNIARSFTLQESLRVSAQSPILGFGNTRDALGSGQTIAVGRSDGCPRCGNLSLGSNGQLWFVLIGQGIVGVLAYILFFARAAWVYRRDGSPLGIAGTLCMLLPLWYMFVYNAAPTPIFFYFLGYGTLWRYGVAAVPTSRRPVDPVREPAHRLVTPESVRR